MQKIDGHPEHYSDKIEEYSSELRYIPTPLLDLLLEQAGHRCTICREPSYDIHHIEFMERGGKTEYENLIVLCPNCHRRVHKENVPNQRQLKHYKLKLEVSYSLPIIGHLTKEEKQFIKELCKANDVNDLISYLKPYYDVIEHSDEVEAKKILREKIGLFRLEVHEIIRTDYEFAVYEEDEMRVHIKIIIRVTPKGIKWIEYLKNTQYLSLLD